MSEAVFPQFLGFLLSSIPTILACAAGIVLAAVTWKRHPRVSRLLVIAFAVLFVLPGLAALESALLVPALVRNSGARSAGVLFGILGFGRSLVVGGAYALLAWAALAGRRTPGS